MLGACATHVERTQAFRDAWGRGDFSSADQEINALLADEADVSVESLSLTQGLSPDLDPSDDDTFLFLLEKGMVRLALGDPQAAQDLFRRGRDELDRRFHEDTDGFLGKSASVIQAIHDDRALDYVGADYEHVLVRVLLTLADLVSGGQDAYAYALQIGVMQEQILGSEFGEEQGYRPRENYRRIAFGAYLEGILKEANLESDEARLAYGRALNYDSDRKILQAARDRLNGGQPSQPGHGRIHVFYLGGTGPHLEETQHEPSSLAISLAGVVAAILLESPAPLVQTAVPVPRVEATTPFVPERSVVVNGAAVATTEPLLDVNEIAREQLDANLPWIVARAVIRRTVKSAAALAAQHGTKRALERSNGTAGEYAGAIGALVGALFNLAATATEHADTRIWSSLPAQIQVARVSLPAGVHQVSLGPGISAAMRVRSGADSTLLVLQPNLSVPGAVLQDPRSVPSNP